MSMLRRILLSAAIAAACAVSTGAHAQTSPLGAALIAFEEAVTWEAVSGDWRGIRPGWVQQASAAKTPQEIAVLMVQLETSMDWSAVEEARWRVRREPWLAEAQRAGTAAEVARLLLELEARTARDRG